eukprot:scaffold741_cov336-Pavlova_lutheri.AAC.9
MPELAPVTTQVRPTSAMVPVSLRFPRRTSNVRRVSRASPSDDADVRDPPKFTNELSPGGGVGRVPKAQVCRFVSFPACLQACRGRDEFCTKKRDGRGRRAAVEAQGGGSRCSSRRPTHVRNEMGAPRSFQSEAGQDKHEHVEGVRIRLVDRTVDRYSSLAAATPLLAGEEDPSEKEVPREGRKSRTWCRRASRPTECVVLDRFVTAQGRDQDGCLDPRPSRVLLSRRKGVDSIPRASANVSDAEIDRSSFAQGHCSWLARCFVDVRIDASLARSRDIIHGGKAQKNQGGCRAEALHTPWMEGSCERKR